MLAIKLILLVGVIFSGVNGGSLRAVSYAQQPSVLVKQVVQPEPYDVYPQYNYGYSIQDPITGDQKGQQESRDGDVVRGSYSLVEPDGTLRTVTYTAGKDGFQAVVNRQVNFAAATPVFAPRPIAPVQQQFQFLPQQQFQFRPIRPALQPLPVRPVQVVQPVRPVHVVQRPVQIQPIETQDAVIVQEPEFSQPPQQIQPQPIQPQPIQPQPIQPQPIQPQPIQPQPIQPQPIQPQPIQPAPQPLPVEQPQQPQFPVEPQPAPQPQPIQRPQQPAPQPQPVQQRPEVEETQDAFIVNNPSVRRADAGFRSGALNGGSSFSVRSSRDGQYNYNFAY